MARIARVNDPNSNTDIAPTAITSTSVVPRRWWRPAIVNGLSCMSCQKEGMIDPPADEIREFPRLFGKERE